MFLNSLETLAVEHKPITYIQSCISPITDLNVPLMPRGTLGILKGDAENARNEIARHEHLGPNCKGGKYET